MTSETDLCYLPATELARRIARRALSPVELIDAVLARIEAVEPTTNAYITVAADQARADARRAEDAVMRNALLGPLHGVPFSVKDLVATAGVRTTMGSLIFETNVPDRDAVSVARLKAAGAILVGKVTTPEFGHKPFTDAPLFGVTRNPWDLNLSPGGSSGGSAAAVAAGLAPLSVGTDGGGSIRIPAAASGIVGMKPSLGRVPHDSAPDGFGNLSYIGPMTRTVGDAAVMLQVMAGPDRADPLSLGLGPPPAMPAGDAADLARLRIAYRRRLGNQVVDREVLADTDAAVAALAERGAVIEDVDQPFENTEPFWLVITQALWAARFTGYLERWRDRMTPTLVRQIEAGADYTAVDLAAAIFKRTEIFRQVEGWFQDHDLAVTPTLSRPALAADHDFFAPIEIDGRPVGTVRPAWYPYTHPFNLTGHPAITVPSGFTAAGLPTGLQIVGRIGADATVLQAAFAVESARPWADRRPRLATDR